MVAAICGKTTGESQREISVGLDLELKSPEKTFVQKDDSVSLQITLSAEQFLMLQQCRDLAANTLIGEKQDASLASVIGLLAESFLASKKISTKQNTTEDAADSSKIEPENFKLQAQKIIKIGIR